MTRLPPRAPLDLLRFTTAGSVDDGKSTLIGRLLYDTKQVFDDQLEHVAQAKRAPRRRGLARPRAADRRPARRARAGDHDRRRLPLLPATPRRPADASSSPTAPAISSTRATWSPAPPPPTWSIVLLDAGAVRWSSPGVTPSSARCWAYPICVVAVNKMDLVDYAQEPSNGSRRVPRVRRQATEAPANNVTSTSRSRPAGDNVVQRSERMPWYDGLHAARPPGERCEVATTTPTTGLSRFPVQWVSAARANGRGPLAGAHYRGYAGQLASGTLRRGDEVLVLPAGQRTRIDGIDTYDGPLAEAMAPLSVTLRLEDDLDLARGELICQPRPRPRSPASWSGGAVLDDRAPPAPPRRAAAEAHDPNAQRRRCRARRTCVDVRHARPRPRAEELGLNDIGRVRSAPAPPCLRSLHRNRRPAASSSRGGHNGTVRG